MRLLTYNIRRGGIGREKEIAEVIAAQAPDLVVLQEATRPEVVARVAAVTGMPQFGATRGRSLAFLSRLPIAAYRWERPRWSQHAFLEIVTAPRGFRVFGVHLSAVHAAWTEARRVRELRSLLAAIGERAHGPHVLAGDFNTLAPGERLDVARLPGRLRLLVWLSGGRIRWQTIAIVLGGGYVDAFRHLHASGDGFTFPTWDPHVRLDYVFVPKSWAPHLAACEVIAAGDSVLRASDHFPVLVELRSPNG